MDDLLALPPNVRLFTSTAESTASTTGLRLVDGILQVVTTPDTVEDKTDRLMDALQHEAGRAVIVDYNLVVNADRYPFLEKEVFIHSPTIQDLKKVVERTPSDTTVAIIGWQSWGGDLIDLEDILRAASERSINLYMTWTLPDRVEQRVIENAVALDGGYDEDNEEEWFDECDRVMSYLGEHYPGRYYFSSDYGVMTVILLTPDKSILENLMPNGVWETVNLSEQAGWDVVPGDEWGV